MIINDKSINGLFIKVCKNRQLNSYSFYLGGETRCIYVCLHGYPIVAASLDHKIDSRRVTSSIFCYRLKEVVLSKTTEKKKTQTTEVKLGGSAINIPIKIIRGISK